MTVLSLASVLHENARRQPDKLALVEGATRLTFGQAWEQALRQAGALVAAGVRPGDRVALMCPNTAEFPVAYYAVLAAGGVVVPVHLLLTADEVAYVLADSGASLLLTHAAVAVPAAKAAGAAGVPVLGLGAQGPEPRLEDAAAAAVPLPRLIPRQADDPAVVFYTSGTTGQPKGALLSHLNLVMNATVSAFDANDVRRDDIVLGALPLFHAYGQTVAMNATWRAGATLVLLPRFDGRAAVALMLAERVNSFQAVPQMFIGLLEAARVLAEEGAASGGELVLPKLRMCISGGASLPPTVLERFNQVFETVIYEGYGLSETSPTATVNQPAFGTRDGTVGHALWGVETEIARPELDDRIELLPPGELGEVVVRGHNVFLGYLGRPEATAEAVVDGWFRTGDLGTKDEAGFLTIVDRKKDVVIRGGFNVYPREVEEALLRHPGVGQVAVIGLADPVHGEEVCAVVVRAPGAAEAVTADELVDWAREHMGRHKYPRRVEFVDELPLGPSLKVLKRELRVRFR